MFLFLSWAQLNRHLHFPMFVSRYFLHCPFSKIVALQWSRVFSTRVLGSTSQGINTVVPRLVLSGISWCHCSGFYLLLFWVSGGYPFLFLIPFSLVFKIIFVRADQQWLIPILLVSWEAEIRRITILGQSGQISLWDSITTTTKAAHAVVCPLPQGTWKV
jgi:hypothetical protein